MSDITEIGRVHGKNHTYKIFLHKGGMIVDDLYVIERDDGKTMGRSHSRADAYRMAHDEAGPDAYES